MMTEQAWCFPVSPLTEMLGMFSVMAEQCVSNLGLPRCYKKGGGQRRVENGYTREAEQKTRRASDGVEVGEERYRRVKRDYLLAHYLSVEVENSSGHVVKEKDRRVLSGKRLRMAAYSNLCGC